MSKLRELRDWLDIVEASNEISRRLDEELDWADVYRLALDGHLTLSVHFVNHASARRGNIVQVENADVKHVPSLNNPNEHVELLGGIRISAQEVLRLDDEIVTLTGIWDLPMIGAERLDVEQKYQLLNRGPNVTLVDINGTFVRDEEGILYQLQEEFTDSGIPRGKRSGTPRRVDNFFPAQTLPEDSVMVVRMSALSEFVDTLLKPGSGQSRDAELQLAANQLAGSWRLEGKRLFSKRDIAVALASSPDWQEMTASRIERIIKVEW